MDTSFSFTTEPCSAGLLEPGDVYLWHELGGIVATREVLAKIAQAPGGMLLEVRKADGNVTRSYLGGVVQRIAP